MTTSYIPVVFMHDVLNVVHEEMDESPVTTLNREGFSTTIRKLICAWDDRYDLIKQLLGYVERTRESTPDLKVFMPHRNPHVRLGDAPDLLVNSIVVAPKGKLEAAGGSLPKSPVASYEKAVLTVNYSGWSSLLYDYLVEEKMEPSAEFLTLARHKYYWDSGQTEPLAAGAEPGVIVPASEWRYTIKQIPYIPPGCESLVGKVNTSAVQSIKYGKSFDPETLLFFPPEIEALVHPFRPGYRITYRMLHRPTGWNLFYKPGTNPPTPSMIYDDSDARVKPYTLAEFDNILVTGYTTV